MAQATTVTPVTMTARMTAIHDCSQQQERKQLQEHRHNIDTKNSRVFEEICQKILRTVKNS
jgi:hypothetical protein